MANSTPSPGRLAALALLIVCPGIGAFVRQGNSGGWSHHQNPSGFTMQHPGGWTVETTEYKGVIVRSPNQNAFVLIQPLFAPRGVKAQGVLGKLMFSGKDLFPKAVVGAVSQLRPNPDEAVGTLTYLSGAGEGRATLLCSLLGESGMLFAIAAPKAQFDRQKQEMVQILRSFSFTRPSAVAQQGKSGAAPALQYVAFQDPKEMAFTAQVPQGWRVNGGTARFSATDVRMFVQASSPDGIFIGFNDPNIPPYIVPDQTLTWTGFGEGRWYPMTDGTRALVMRYQPAIVFAQGYAQSSMARGSAGFQIKDRRDRPDLAQVINRLYAQFNNALFRSQMTFGEVSFACTRNGQPVAGYCLASTELNNAMGLGLWFVKSLYTFLAPEEKVHVASAALNRLIQSFQINPQWFAAQLGTTANVSRIVAEANDHISKVQSESFWSARRSSDRNFQSYSDMTRGITRVQDPVTGQEYEAVAGSNYYWRATGSDRPFSTITADPPRGIDVTPMLVLDR